jgi:16S rRNA (adenine1518-N6/adenine1519-N6)-dimethyltransferase
LAALGDHYALIGNFPYNISTQIVFRMLEERMHIPVAVGMFQKEVGERLAAPPGSKTYGITSVLTQAYYQVKLHIHIPPSSFQPPPKVDSVVLSMERLPEEAWPICGFEPLRKVVKAAFGQRRKTLRNALKSITFHGMAPDDPIWDLRAERLSVQDFTRLALAQMKT